MQRHSAAVGNTSRAKQQQQQQITRAWDLELPFKMFGEVDAWRIKTVLVGLLAVAVSAAEWKEDLSNHVRIGVSDAGYSKVVLDCEDENMAFVIRLEEDFEGVIYTRGSFHTRRGPCFLDASGGKEFALKFSYKDCSTKYDDHLGAYVNTVVVQHDDDLIFPGDLAFDLRCHDQVTVNASLAGVKSRISLVDPDPASQQTTSKDEISATSSSNVVTLMPGRLTPPKEEL